MVFRNIEVDFDIYDADTAEVYEGAVQTVLESAVPKEGESLADGIRRQCNTVFTFFDTLFGDGFHKELFGQRTNMMECLQAFKEFLELVSKQREQLTSRRRSSPRRRLHPTVLPAVLHRAACRREHSDRGAAGMCGGGRQALSHPHRVPCVGAV